MSAHAVRTWLRRRTRRLYRYTSQIAMAATINSEITAASPQSTRQHFSEQLQRIDAQRAGQLRELDDVDAALAAFDLRHVRMRALQPFREPSLRQPGLHPRLRENGTQHTVFATAQCLHGALRFQER